MSDTRNESSPPRRAAADSIHGRGQGQNQGEGNKEAAANFNEAEREFVQSPRGQQKIREGTHAGAREENELDEAEQQAKSRAKAQDSNRM